MIKLEEIKEFTRTIVNELVIDNNGDALLIKDDSDFVNDLHMDSMDVLEIWSLVESNYDILFDPYEVNAGGNINNIARKTYDRLNNNKK
jgi:acyl carrier protein